tara:strand:- start:18790 stop:19812 length:1023 start_codon:yes stop_codon:yes gene_type:complete
MEQKMEYYGTTFGVEVEFNRESLSRLERHMNAELEQHNISVAYEGYNHTTRNHWKLVTDASCGSELVSPVLQGSAGFRELKLVLQALNSFGITEPESTCGVHIHLKPRNLTVEKVKNIYKRYAKYEREIDSWMPPSRRGNRNQWCYSIISNANAPAFEAYQGNSFYELVASLPNSIRYHKVNLRSLTRYGTVEFRQHSASTDYTKISNWIKFLIEFCEQEESDSNFSTTYRRRRKVAYGEIREQVANMGWDLRYAGHQYKLFNEHGELVETIQFCVLEEMYEPNSRTLTQHFVNWFTSHFPVAVENNSVFAGVPEELQNYFAERVEEHIARHPNHPTNIR